MAELRRDWPTVPIVAASGLKPIGTTARAIEDFASTFLLKPYSDDELVRTLNRLLGKVSDSSVSGIGTMLDRG
jgi:CheY-like chemotaxis protein